MNLATHRALAVAAAVVAAATLSGCGEGDDRTVSQGSAMGMSAGASATTRPAHPSGTTSRGTSPQPTPSAPPTAPTSSGSGTLASAPHNQADIDFATAMVPHHAQALVMADMALAHGRTDDFLALAKAIKAAQRPEIDQMSAWLVAWGVSVPATTGHAGPDGHSGTGMMSQKDLDDLSLMRGSGFEGMWLTLMVEHHEGAIEMSRTELSQGLSPQARRLAGAITKAQSREIGQMRTMASQRAN